MGRKGFAGGLASFLGQLWNPFLAQGGKESGTKLVQAWQPSLGKSWHAANTNGSMKQANFGCTLALSAKAKESAILDKDLGMC